MFRGKRRSRRLGSPSRISVPEVAKGRFSATQLSYRMTDVAGQRPSIPMRATTVLGDPVLPVANVRLASLSDSPQIRVPPSLHPTRLRASRRGLGFQPPRSGARTAGIHFLK